VERFADAVRQVAGEVDTELAVGEPASREAG
jgi:hypothetical protein